MKDRRMRIMWNSNAPWAPSGYGVQTRDLLYRFIKDGWTTACVCFYGLEGGMLNLDGLACFPKIGHPYGGDALLLHSKEWKADVAITFQDIWPVGGNELAQLAKERKWVAYVPIDWYPVPPNIVSRLKMAYRVVTFSKAGQEQLKKQGIQSDLILEAVDTKVFRPLDKKKLRKKYGIPEDVFLFGMVAANKDHPPRKSFQQVMEGFKRFNKKHKDSAIYIHSMFEQKGGFNIALFAKHLGIEAQVFSTPPYQYLFKCPHPVINEILNTFDVLLNPSNSEGFGLPIVEAQACGVPVIVNDWASMPELIVDGVTGLKCKTGYKLWTPIQSYKALPDAEDLYQKMEQIYKMDRVKMGKKARDFIVKNFDMEDRVNNEWIPFLEQLQLEIMGKPKKQEVKVNGRNDKKSK